MKKYFLFVLIFISLYTLDAQTKSHIGGIIIYKFSENQRDSLKEKNEIDKLNDLFMKNSKDITFVLKFKDDKSYFYLDEKLENDAKPFVYDNARIVVGKGNYFTDLTNEKIIREHESLGEKFLITSKTKTFADWKLTKESKLIGKYKCYKAITTKTIINPTGEFNFTIEAWYTPQLPMKFGVKEYNNLPGLILELKDTHFTFYAHKIKLVKKEEIEIKKPKGKTITEKEYQEKVSKASSFLMLDKKN